MHHKQNITASEETWDPPSVVKPSWIWCDRLFIHSRKPETRLKSSSPKGCLLFHGTALSKAEVNPHVTSDLSFWWKIAVCYCVLIPTSLCFSGIVFCMTQLMISFTLTNYTAATWSLRKMFQRKVWLRSRDKVKPAYNGFLVCVAGRSCPVNAKQQRLYGSM